MEEKKIEMDQLSERLQKGTESVGQLMRFREEFSKISDMKKSIEDYVAHASYSEELDDVIAKVEAFGDNRASIIRTMSWEELQELFTKEDGTKIVLNVQGSEKEKAQFYKDFALYLVDTKVQMENIEKTLAQFDEEMDVLMKDLNECVGEVGDMPALMELNMKSIIDNAKDPIQKKRAMMGLAAMEDCWTLNKIVDYYNMIGTKNLLKEFKSKNGQQRVAEKYNLFLRKTGLHSTVAHFGDIETRFLEEKYHENKNLFVFMLIKYFGCNASDSESMVNKLFLTQLVTILSSLYTDSLLPEHKEAILTGIRNVLDSVVE